MTLRSGLGGQVGYKAETDVGTAVVVDTFLPFISEGIERVETFVESEALYTGRRVRQSTQWGAGAVDIKGPLTTELFTTSIRPLLKAMFGTESGSGPYTYTMADTWGQSLTVQLGRPGVGGLVHPYTYAGMKVESWSIDASVGATVKLTPNFVGCLVDEATGTALASASYASMRPFTWVDTVIELEGTGIPVMAYKLDGDNKMNTSRRFLGQRLISQPIHNALASPTGTLDMEFTDDTLYALYRARTELALVSTFTSGTAVLEITKNIRLDGKTPTLAGAEIVKQSVPFTVIASSNDASGISVVYTPPS